MDTEVERKSEQVEAKVEGIMLRYHKKTRVNFMDIINLSSNPISFFCLVSLQSHSTLVYNII